MSTPTHTTELSQGLLAQVVLDLARHAPLAPEPVQNEVAVFVSTEDAAAVLGTDSADSDVRARVFAEVVRLAVRGGLHPLLAAYGVSAPTYNLSEGFDGNKVKPWVPTRAIPAQRTPPLWTVLGKEVAFPIGVPASVLTTNSRWVDYYARQGFNVLTYKTVRSEPYEAHPAPNWVFLKDEREPMDEDALGKAVRGDTDVWPEDPRAFSMANSFGVPSQSPDEWQADVDQTLGLLSHDQLLIVSVMGYHEKNKEAALIDDFVHVAELAAATQPPAIELNLSCPNTVDPDEARVKREFLCHSADATRQIVTRVRERIGDCALCLKFARTSRERLEEVIVPLAREGLIDGISGINTVQMEVHDGSGEGAFPSREGIPRDVAGVSGIAIRDFGLRFVSDLADLRRSHNLSFDILGMGGVMSADDVLRYQRAGSTAVQTATAAFFNPDLPQEVHSLFIPLPEEALEARSRFMASIDEEPRTLEVLAEELSSVVSPTQALREKARTILDNLEAEGLVTTTVRNGNVVYGVSETVPVVEQ